MPYGTKPLPAPMLKYSQATLSGDLMLPEITYSTAKSGKHLFIKDRASYSLSIVKLLKIDVIIGPHYMWT